MNTSKKIGFSGSKLTKPSCLKHANTTINDQDAGFVEKQFSDCLDACIAAALRCNAIPWPIVCLYTKHAEDAGRPCSQLCSYATNMLHRSQDMLADLAATLSRYLLSSRMADAKSPAATWSAAREHFCSQRCVGVTPGVGATNWLSSPGAVLASATISGGRSRSCMGTTHI